MELRYGLNPDQRATATIGAPGSPVQVVSGHPSMINLLDAIGAWRLAREAAAVLATPAAVSVKHVSPAGAAIAGPLDEVMTQRWLADGIEPSPVTTAYIRSRDCDPKSSFGDFVAVSEPVDSSLAEVLRGVVSDGIVAPGYEPGTVEILSSKKGGRYLVLEVEPNFEPPLWEAREVFGIRLEQHAAQAAITETVVRSGTDTELPDAAVRDLLLALVTARHAQSNTVTYARDGMVLGVGAGQQSRVDCTRLAGAKVDTWWLRRHDKVRRLPFRPEIRRQDRINWEVRYIEGDLDPGEASRFRATLTREPEQLTVDDRADWLGRLNNVALASDGYIPFRDNIDQAARHGVRYIAEPGGSTRNHQVDEACSQHGITHIATDLRLFLH